MDSKRITKGSATQLESRRLSWGCLRMGEHILSYNDSVRMTYGYAYWIMLVQDCLHQAKSILHEYNLATEITDFVVASEAMDSAYRMISLYRLCREDVQENMDMFKAALLALRHIPTENVEDMWYSGALKCTKQLYKEYGGSGHGVAWGLIRAFIASTIMTQDYRLFKITNDIVQYLVRITLQDVNWIIDKSVDEYVEFENSLHSQSYRPEVVQEVASIVQEWLEDFDTALPEMVDKLQAEHGYGATAEVRRSEGTAAKYRNVHMTPEAYYLAKAYKWIPLDHIWPGLTRESIISHSLAKRKLPVALYSADMLGEIQFVPKGTNKKRVVSKEPTTNQFFQKKNGMVMDLYFRDHPEMHIDLHNQEHNRSLALEGSESGKYATIDLSSASDSVTITLVRMLLKDGNSGSKCLLRLLEWCRTRQVRIKTTGEPITIALEKFAPMGAGHCFPVECMVFSAVVATVLKRHGKHSRYWVYGDDIVVPSWAYDEVIELLEELHFYPNEEKSYGHGSLFTESCGIECFRGHDVSPIRISRKWDHVAREQGLVSQAHAKRKEEHFNRNTKSTYYRILKRKGRKAAYEYQSCRRTELERRKKKWVKDGNVGVTQLASYYRMANDATDNGYYCLAAALQSQASQLYDAPLWSLNHVYGFFTPDRALLEEKLIGRWVYDEDIQDYFVFADALRVSVEPGEDVLRYSKTLESLSTSHRSRLQDPEDLVETACGAARTFLRYVRVPYRDLISYDEELINLA